jgi:hypothetical protein
MKKFLSFILLIFCFGIQCLNMLNAQSIQDFSVKNSSNDIERNFMLDLLRAKIKSEFKQNAKFSINHFLLSGNYAWFTGGVMRSDGSRLVFPKVVDYYDCCHIEALFEKDSKGKWKIAESNAFSTDVWYTCIGSFP